MAEATKFWVRDQEFNMVDLKELKSLLTSVSLFGKI